ncbi:hypothetical protein [Streptomyces candidus]|uniref:MFS family permease n=1 Tax=Streptomyces candidus TaxID=67283 RepID=A0A7X0HCB7_9ACTN|nr:hypothetical protein [Streptomyces candidus]MBB6435018.1 MFS family permease [Streptomyces candidus]GHH41016.1 hypothetical protein GCM10018773_23510 [Streptomyces candidus]
MNSTADKTELTGYDRRMRALMNDPRGRVLHATKGRRRAAVAASVGLTAAAVTLVARMFTYDELWAAFALLPVLLLWCLATGALNSATRGLFELRVRALDERQLLERERARSAAHMMTGALIFGAAVGLWVSTVLGDGHLTRAYVAPLLAGVFVLHWMMPLWIAGLLAQDAPADDSADDGEGPSYG